MSVVISEGVVPGGEELEIWNMPVNRRVVIETNTGFNLLFWNDTSQAYVVYGEITGIEEVPVPNQRAKIVSGGGSIRYRIAFMQSDVVDVGGSGADYSRVFVDDSDATVTSGVYFVEVKATADNRVVILPAAINRIGQQPIYVKLHTDSTLALEVSTPGGLIDGDLEHLIENVGACVGFLAITGGYRVVSSYNHP